METALVNASGGGTSGTSQAQAPLGLVFVAVRGCWEIEDWPEDALRALLTQAYGPSEAALQSLVKAVRDATYLLPRNPPQAARVLQGLPEPLADADPRLTQAERLLKAGANPRSLATAMRRAGLNLRSAPAWSERLTLCDKGVVLGYGTVIVDLADHPNGSTGLAVEGNEANILALLSVASGRLVSPEALAKLASASRSLAKGNVAQAAIALCHIGQPPLEDQDLAKGLTVAASCLSRGHSPGDVMKACGLQFSREDIEAFEKSNPNHVPAGCPQGGQFCSSTEADDLTYGGAASAPKLPQVTAPYASWDAYQSSKESNAAFPQQPGSIEPKDWSAMRQALSERSDLSENQKIAILSLYGREGGFTENPENGAVAGLTQTALNEINQDPPKSLSQIIDCYVKYLNYVMPTVGGIMALNGIDNTKAAAAFADTMFYQGRGGGPNVLQKSINDVLDQIGEERILNDRQMGPGLLSAYTRLANDPRYTSLLLDALYRRRVEWSERRNKGTAKRGDVLRFNSYR